MIQSESSRFSILATRSLRLSKLLRSISNAMAMSTKKNDVPSERQGIRLAVLHQAIEPPAIGGAKKAMKPGGYRDSSADVAYVLRQYNQASLIAAPKVEVVTPTPNPDPANEADWSFPDTESGLLSAIKEHEATHLWANTVVFASHPLQTSVALDSVADRVYVVGQPPQLVEMYDDKNWVNDVLAKDGRKRCRMPRSWVVSMDKLHVQDGLQSYLSALNLPYPVVGKPIRGRGSHGVKLCHTLEQLMVHLNAILAESPQVMVEEFLAGQECTVTVMPPGQTIPKHWALPVVERFNHCDGVAPYNGVVAVLQNSRVVPLNVQDYKVTADGDLPDVDTVSDANVAYVDVRRQCEMVAETLGCTAPIRIDVRRRKEGGGSTIDNPFVLFDVNMKPHMTGPGRPGRENQASLTAMAAQALGWDYARLLTEMLKTATPLTQLRQVVLPKGWS